MCGRFTLRTPTAAVVEQFSVPGESRQLPLRFNIAPTQEVAVVRQPEGSRELALLHWGLVPFWATDKKVGNRMINARAESVADKPAFRAAFKKRRCLVVADGYYEWRKAEGAKTAKQPFYIRRQDERPFAMAGLWERCDKLDAPLESCTIITTSANELTSPIHDRMPVILLPEEYDLWLNAEFADKTRLAAMLRPYQSDDMLATPISTRVNNPRNESPECLEGV